MNQPVSVNRPLTDAERQLLDQLTVWVVAEQCGWTDDDAAIWLDDINDKIGLSRQGDNIDVAVTTGNGHTLLHCSREWLTYWAVTDAVVTSHEIRRHVAYGGNNVR